MNTLNKPRGCVCLLWLLSDGRTHQVDCPAFEQAIEHAPEWIRRNVDRTRPIRATKEVTR